MVTKHTLLWLLASVYAALALIGYLLMIFQLPPAAHFELTRNVHANHRLVDNDVRYVGFPARELLPWLPEKRAFDGRYAQRESLAAQTLDTESTRSVPALQRPPNAFLYWHPVAISRPRADDYDADVGRFADLCGTIRPGKYCIKTLAIASISCATDRPPQRCFTGLWVPERFRSALMTLLQHKSKVQPGGGLQLFVESPGGRP